MPPLFWQVYVTDDVICRYAVAGVFPRPLRLPVAVADPSVFQVSVGPECHVIAARAMLAVIASVATTAARIPSLRVIRYLLRSVPVRKAVVAEIA